MCVLMLITVCTIASITNRQVFVTALARLITVYSAMKIQKYAPKPLNVMS